MEKHQFCLRHVNWQVIFQIACNKLLLFIPIQEQTNGCYKKIYSSLRVLTDCPLPSHSIQGNLINILVPWQCRHVERITNGPGIDKTKFKYRKTNPILPWQDPAWMLHSNIAIFIDLPLEKVSMPEPLQYVHLMALVPGSQREPWHLGQVSTTFTFMSLFTPRAASVNRRFTITWKIIS